MCGLVMRSCVWACDEELCVQVAVNVQRCVTCAEVCHVTQFRLRDVV